MPGFNQTGPNGQGPRTGRGLGKCKGTPTEDTLRNENDSTFGQGRGPGQGRGMGAGRGMGRGAGAGQGRGMGRNQQNNG
ncbi:MAG: DUF5320 domain-containing protein [Bacteroidales bacterium]|nr:DUF5320 domain-containing protein [Bacteroidales bacterium]